MMDSRWQPAWLPVRGPGCHCALLIHLELLAGRTLSPGRGTHLSSEINMEGTGLCIHSSESPRELVI